MKVKLNVTINEFSIETSNSTITSNNAAHMVPAGMKLEGFSINYENEMDSDEYRGYIKLTGEMLAELIENMRNLTK